jgi:hypothetical protein
MNTQTLALHRVHVLIPEKSKRFQYIMSLKLQLHSQHDAYAVTDSSIIYSKGKGKAIPL